MVKDTPKKGNSPKITYQEVNPTYYIVNIKDATAPFVLTLAETYSKDWKAYVVNNKNDLALKGNVVASYSGGLVKEMEYLNSANVREVLNTFKEKSVLETSHISVNGFGNAWLIDQKGSYTIKLVFQPQRYFLIGFFISIITLLVVLFGIIYITWKKLKIKLK